MTLFLCFLFVFFCLHFAVISLLFSVFCTVPVTYSQGTARCCTAALFSTTLKKINRKVSHGAGNRSHGKAAALFSVCFFLSAVVCFLFVFFKVL